MRIFWETLRDCGRRLCWPFLLALAMAFFAVRAQGADEAAAGTRSLWLHLPALLLTAAGLGATLEAWPLYSRARPGAELIAHLRTGRLEGCAAAAAGGLSALALALCVTAVLFDSILGGGTGDRPAVSVVELRGAPGGDRLDRGHPVVSMVVPTDEPVRALHLHSRVYWPRDGELAPATVKVSADGEELHELPIEVLAQSALTLRFKARTIGHIEIERLGVDGVDLWFPPGNASAELARENPALLNAVCAGLSYLFPAALALALACAGRRHLALPVALALCLCVLVASTLSGFTPNTDAVESYARGQWVLSRGLTPGFWSLSTIGLVMLLAVFAGRRKSA